MDETAINTLYGWRGRVHKAILVYEQCKLEYVRVCALPRTKEAFMRSIKGTTCNHDADIALTWGLLEAAKNVVEATCDGYISSIRRSFNAYRKMKENNIPTISNTDTIIANDIANNVDGATIDVIVENIINSNITFVQQWREIISGAQKEMAGWKGEHKKYLECMCEVDGSIKTAAAVDYEHADDDDDDDGDRLRLLRMGIRVDEHTERLLRMGTCLSAGKVLITSLKIVRKIESIETATQEAGTACIVGITRSTLHSSINNNEGGGDDNSNDDEENNGRDEMIYKSESKIVEEWNIQAEATKLDSVYRWYRMHNGTLSSINMKHV